MKRNKAPKRKSPPQKKYGNSTNVDKRKSGLSTSTPTYTTNTLHSNIALNVNLPTHHHNHPSTSYLQPHNIPNNQHHLQGHAQGQGQHPNDPSLLLLPCYVGMDMMEKLQVEYRHQQQQQMSISHPQHQLQSQQPNILQQHYLPVTGVVAATLENSSMSDKQGSSECPRCLKRLEIPRNMKRHLEGHEGHGTNVRPHPCSLCDKSFKQASHAKAHLSVHNVNGQDGEGDIHRPSGGIGEMAACPVCFIEFKHGRNYKRHMLIHEGVKAYSCDVCGRRFRQAIHLKTHQLSHQGIKAYSCPQCGKSFGRADNLKRHELIHSGLKPFSCLSCGKSYTQSHHLKSHISKCTM